MNKYVVEFIGTLFLVLVVGLTAIAPHDAGSMAPLAIASTLMVMIYAGGHISGGHYNPAVTTAAVVRGACKVGDAIGYIVAQVAAGLVAALLVGFLKPGATPTPGSSPVSAVVVAEFLFTFALAYVVLNVATAKKNAGNSFYGLAIGFTVLAGAYAVGPVSGGAFNPAVAVGAVSLGAISAGMLVYYVLAEIVAGAVAGIVFKVLSTEDRD